jgi:hypothetical protein
MAITFDTAPRLTEPELRELLGRAYGIDTVRLTVAVPEEPGFATATALGVDALNAPAGKATFFDTPDLTLQHAGIAVRARRIGDRRPETAIVVRPIDPHELPPRVCLSKRFALEVEALPGFYVSSGSVKGRPDDDVLADVIAGRRRLSRAFSKQQRAFFAEQAPAGVELDDLRALGSIDLLKLKLVPDGLDRRLTVEVWSYPDGSRVTVLSAKAKRAHTLAAFAELRTFLAERGVGISAVQHTKLSQALEHFADL